MELVTELLLSVFVAIALSFLVAKLVSAILAPDNGAGRGSEAKIAGDEKVVMEELRLRSAERGESESRVEGVFGEVKEVERFGARVPESDSVEVCDESEVVGLSVEPSSSGQESEASRLLERGFELVEEMNISSTGLDTEEGVEKKDDDCDDQQIEVHADEIGSSPREESQKNEGDEENQQSRGAGNEEIGVVGPEEEENQPSGGDGNEEIGVVRCEDVKQQSEGGVNYEIGVVGCEEVNQQSERGVNDEIGVFGVEEQNQPIGVVRCEGEDLKNDGNDEIGVVRCEEESHKSGGRDATEVVRCEENVDGGSRGVEVEVDGDDDWEGIERSEMGEVFAAAAKYVASGNHTEELAGLGSDVEMELYGLHKVATEGPCHESQPMALRVSARANWNAWQRLGNMNPDVAMERYVALLSEKIPGWMKDNYAGDSKRDVFQEGTTSTQDPKSSTFPEDKPSLTNESKPEMKSVDNPSHLLERVKE